MRKAKKFTPKKSSKVMNTNDEESDDRNMSETDSDSNQLNDEIDSFHHKRDEQLFKKSAFNGNTNFDDDNDETDEEVLPFESEDESSDDRNEDVMNRFEVQLRKDEMASDLEDDDEEDLPDSHAWGRSKRDFYNTDYVDKDFRNNRYKDENQAQYEEEEALAIQKRLLESMNESDLGFNLFVGDIEPKIVDENGIEDKDEDEQRVKTNVLNLTKRQKMEILSKESPELESLISDFQTYMTEVRDRLHPIIELIKSDKLEACLGTHYIETRYHLIINYCINICFYMVLKTKRITVKDHPIIKQILIYKKLLLELNDISLNNNSINNDIELLIKKLNSGQEISKKKINNKRKTEQILSETKKVKFAENLFESQMSEVESNENVIDNEDYVEDDVEESFVQNSKRGITYEIAKNKGLTPKRKKELKNPRVKHRMKYRRAKIRRKGQVREPRKELQRYGGEISGIKSGVIKSVKFK